jgi:hypothetical protein
MNSVAFGSLKFHGGVSQASYFDLRQELVLKKLNGFEAF